MGAHIIYCSQNMQAIPYCLIASSAASMTKKPSSVFDNLQASTNRENQSR